MAQLSSNIYEAGKDAAEVATWLQHMMEDRRRTHQQLNRALELLKDAAVALGASPTRTAIKSFLDAVED